MATVTPKLDQSPDDTIKRQTPPKEMISVRKLEDGRVAVKINASSLQIIQECMRKAKYSLHEGWISREENPATIFGTAVHSFLENFYGGAFEDRKLPKLTDLELMAAGQTLDGEAEDLCLSSFRKFLDKHKPIEALPPQDKRSSANAAWILHHYMKSFLDDPYVAYVDESGPFLERTFTYKIFEDESLVIEIFGTVDFVMQNLKSGKLLPGDFKTSSFLGFGGSSYFDREKPNHQYSCYVLGLQQVYGIETESFMVQILEVKKRPQKGKGPSFPRQITTRTAEDLLEFREALTYYALNYIEAIKEDFWPQGPVQSCSSYGSCQYRQVCSSPKSMRGTLLKNKFERKSNAELK